MPACPLICSAKSPSKSQERIDDEKRMFDKARRSLRIWPLGGENPEEIMEAVKDFCYNALLLPETSNLGIEAVARVRSSPRGHSFKEVIVIFEDNYHRDRILACGPKLAGYRDDDRKPTCGIRLQIPGHLLQQFKVLENFAFARKRDFQGRIKKHIKFDDVGNCLFLQMKHLDDEEWSNFSYEQALAEQEKGNQKRIKKSLLLRSPEQPTQIASSPAKKRVAPSREKTSSNFVPLKRSTNQSNSNAEPSTSAAGSNNWRPERREEEDMDY